MRRWWAPVVAAGIIAPLCCGAPAYAEDQSCKEGVVRYIEEKPQVFAQLGMSTAWRLGKGTGVRIAVVDSGVDPSSPHLKEALDPGHDFIGGTAAGATDTFGHGTALAGQIASRKVEGSGLTGIAPGTRIVPVRVYAADRQEPVPDPARTAQGITWAADQGGIPVILVAMSTEVDSPALKGAVQYATAKGSLVVASAGNLDSASQPGKPVYPAAYPEVLSVTAVSGNGLPSESVLSGEHVDVAAPAEAVMTTMPGSGDCIIGGAPQSSYAAGYAAGIAALVAGRYPWESPSDWKYRLLATAIRPAAQQRNDRIGWGVIAPYQALNFVNDGTIPGPQNPRYPAPSPQTVPVLDPPVPVPDYSGRIQWAVSLSTLAVLALVSAGLLARRLKREE